MSRESTRSKLRQRASIAAALALLALAGCSEVPRPAGDGTLRYRDPVFANVSVTRDLQYGSAPDKAGNPVSLRLDAYQPAGDSRSGRPAVIFVHGGGFSGGDKGSGVSPDLAGKFAKLGYVTFSINYRLSATNGCSAGNGTVSNECFAAALDAQHDAQAAVRWVRANAAGYRIDTTRIGIGGESAGAITATTVGVHSEDPGSSGNPGYPSTVRAFMSISGGLPQGVFASAGDAAGLFFHGTADNVVPAVWSQQTYAALLNVGVPAFLQLQQGAGHVPYAQYGDLYYTQSVYFFYHLMDLGHAQGQPSSAARAADRQVARLARLQPSLAKRFRGWSQRTGSYRSAARR